jgi:hypothetical protein
VLVTDKGPRLAATAAEHQIVAVRAPLAHGGSLSAAAGSFTAFIASYRFDSEAAIKRVRMHGELDNDLPLRLRWDLIDYSFLNANALNNFIFRPPRLAGFVQDDAGNIDLTKSPLELASPLRNDLVSVLSPMLRPRPALPPYQPTPSDPVRAPLVRASRSPRSPTRSRRSRSSSPPVTQEDDRRPAEVSGLSQLASQAVSAVQDRFLAFFSGFSARYVFLENVGLKRLAHCAIRAEE